MKELGNNNNLPVQDLLAKVDKQTEETIINGNIFEKQITSLSNRFQVLSDYFVKQSAIEGVKQKEETREEAKSEEKRNDSLLDALGELKKSFNEIGSSKGGFLKLIALITGGILVGVTALGAGFVTGLFMSIKKLDKILFKGKLLGGITKIVENIKNRFAKSKLVKNLVKIFDKAKSIFTNIADFAKSIFGKIQKVIAKLKTGKSGKFLINVFTRAKSIFSNMGTLAKELFSEIKSIFSEIGDITTKFKNSKAVTSLLKILKIGGGGGGGSLLKGFGSIFKVFFSMGKLVGRFVPFLAPILAVIDTVKGAIKGFKEEGIIGGIKGAITGFVNGLIFGPLDLIKDATAWILGKLGFDKASELLKGFSFQEIFTNGIDFIFNGFSSAVDFLKDLFTFPKTFGEGLEKLVDILNAPLNLAINFVRGLFGFDKDADGEKKEPFKLSKFISEKIEQITAYIKELFSFENIKKSIGGVLDKITDGIPFFGKKEEKTDAEKLAEKLADADDKIKDLRKAVIKQQKDVNTDNWLEGEMQKTMDKNKLARLQKELNDARMQRETMLSTNGGTNGGGAVINAPTSTSNSATYNMSKSQPERSGILYNIEQLPAHG